MKPGNIFKTQMSLLLFIVFPLITGMCSCNKDLTDELDITTYKWELTFIKQEGKTHNIPEEDFHNPTAYVLWFENDSVFSLDFSINTGKGEYEIISKGTVNIISFSNITEAAMTDFDDKLLSAFKKMTSYTVKGNTLTFKGYNSEVEFKQK